MRRFATWTTGHRRTVIIGWILAVIGFGMLAGAAGSDFTEEFSLPNSDSKDALDLLENRFPAQAGDTVQIVYKAESGVESPAVQSEMEAVFKKVEAFPHVSEVASPYQGGGAGAVSEDGKIAYATGQFNVTTDKLGDDEVKEIMDIARDAGGDGLQVEVGGSPAEEVRSEEEESFSEGIGILAAVVVLLISFGSVVAMGLPILTALFALGVGVSAITLFTHVFDTAESAGAGASSGAHGSRRSSPAGCCSRSASPPSRCGSGPTTPGPIRRGRRRGKPTTCSPKASGPASTGPSCSPRNCPRRATTKPSRTCAASCRAKKASKR